MSLLVLHYLCLVTLLSQNLASCATADEDEPRRTFPFRRAIDGTRGMKFYEPEDDGFLHSYGSSGRYDPDHQANDFSDIRNNVPGEPGVDYPSYTRLPQTGFVCEPEFRGYYADEAAGCQVFHVCDGSFLVSSFLCPMGSIFSQKLLTCDWWIKVDCSTTRSYHAINSQSLVSEADNDEILRKAFEMASVQSAGERIPVETVSQQREAERRYRVLNYGGRVVTERINDLQTGPDNYSDYPDYPSRVQSRFQSRAGQKSRQRYQEDDYYSQDADEDNKQPNNPPIHVHTIGEDRRNDRIFRNEFQPSYAPTVPTVITTTRRFYSPTFPTTYRPSTEREVRRRFDLEVESSDHLYNARGRSDETVKAATEPTVVSKVTTNSKNISLPILVNSADERRDEVENMQESESSHYRTTVTLPAVQINASKAESSTEAIISKGGSDDIDKITETFSILTIDNENHNPNKFAYNREEETSYRNKTNVAISSILAGVNSTSASSPEADKKSGKIAAFLQPPQEVANQFRIMVLEESSTPKSHQETFKSEGLDENNSNSGVELIKSIELPVIRITPPLYDGNEAARESRVIRIVVNKDNTSSNSFSSINPESLTEKIALGDSIPLVEDNKGEHSETKIVSQELPKEQEEVVNKISGNKNLTSDAETVSSTGVSSNDATGTSSKLENPHSIDVINVAVALEESGFNAATEAPVESRSTVSEEKKSEDHKKSEDVLLNSKTIISEEKIGEDYQIPSGSEETLSTKTTISEEKESPDYKKSEEILLSAKTTVSEEKTGENYQQSSGSEETLSTKTTISQEKESPEYKKSEEILLNANTTVSEEKTGENYQKPSGSEESLSAKAIISQEKSIERSIGSEEILLDATTKVSKEKISEDHEHSIGSEETLLNVKTTDFETNDSDTHERLSRSDEIALIGGNIEDTVVEGSSPFQITVTLNKDEELDPNGEVIRRLIAKQEIGDPVVAADYKNFEIVKSDEPEASKAGPEDFIAAADSRSGRRIDLERDISEEKLPNFRSNSLQSRDYYRSIVGLVNGPNLPRPFSFVPPQNVRVRTPSDIGDAGPSTTAPLASGTFRNDLIPVTTQISAQATRQSIASSSRESEPLKKLSASSKIELANNERVLEQLSQTFGERQLKVNKEKLIFELPQEQRSLDFETGHPLEISQQVNSRVDEESEELRTTQRSNEKLLTKTVIETEFIPSISFSLNTDEEREEYMDAVIKGLLSDVRATESTNNDTNTSVES